MHTKILYNNAAVLGASGVLASLPVAYAGPLGLVSIQAVIDNGAGGNPADTPAGAWEMYVASEGSDEFARVSGTEADAELAKIAPNGNTRVSAWANFSGFPGARLKLRYARTSGGAQTSRATIIVTSR